jgi:hypothetical protein
MMSEHQRTLFTIPSSTKDPAAIFTNNDLFMHPDIELVLRRYLIETSAAGIAFDLDYGKPVPRNSCGCGCRPGQQPVLDILPVLPRNS